MLDELKEEEIVKKVGGRFKLSSLIQKRMVVLKRRKSRAAFFQWSFARRHVISVETIPSVGINPAYRKGAVN